jgi:cholesterol oxidase
MVSDSRRSATSEAERASPDAIVVGSGFGGAVVACRLAQSGRRVLVLERGPRRSGNDFPRLATAKIQDWLWTSSWNGFWDFRVFRHIATLTCTGVGGGSHCYANVHIRAPEETFRQGWPRGVGADTLAPYYDRVERMLHVRPFPSTIQLTKTRAVKEAAKVTNAHVFHPNLAVYFNEDPTAPPNQGVPEYVRDPYNLGVDVEQSPCVQSGECDLGCRFGAKNSLDLNYLAIAEQRHGATIQPLSDVFAVAPEGRGYRVHYRDRITFQRASVWAPLVVLAGNTVSMTELLLRCRDEYQTLPKVSETLGEHFSGNGDFISGVVNTREVLDPWWGPVITTVLQYREDDFHAYLQEGGFPPDLSFLVSAMRPDRASMGYMLRGPVGHLARLRAFFQDIGRLASEHREQLSEHVPGNVMISLSVGQDASDGRIRLHKRIGRRAKLVVEWDNTRTQPMTDRMRAEWKRISRELGGDYVDNPLWRFLRMAITVHPLGGCGLSDDETLGVLSPYGEVWNYSNLYVAGGATIPRSLGPNPALTISAVAERTADYISNAAHD